jgi:hypothetical protein
LHIKSASIVKTIIHRGHDDAIYINEIQEYLWPSEHRTTKHPEKYRVLENVTSGPGFSLAATVSTGAHGNDLNNEIMADSVASFQLLTIDKYWGVKCYQIEPTNGITDPFKGHKYSCISLIVVPASKQRYVAALTLSFRQPTLNFKESLSVKCIKSSWPR